MKYFLTILSMVVLGASWRLRTQKLLRQHSQATQFEQAQRARPVPGLVQTNEDSHDQSFRIRGPMQNRSDT